jgi:hypothetical protein
MINHDIKETLKTVGELSKAEIPDLFFGFRNIGLGPAVDIKLEIKKANLTLKSINDLTKDTHSLYNSCKCVDYYKGEDWSLYPPFSLDIKEEKNFGFTIHSDIYEIFVIQIDYKDILNNGYRQKQFISLDNDFKGTAIYPISQQEKFNPIPFIRLCQ